MSSRTITIAVLPALALAFLAVSASSADAAPNRSHNAYAGAKARAEKKIRIEFRQLDQRRDGVLDKADFTTYTTRCARVGRRWKKVRRPIVSGAYYRLLRVADFNHNGVVTRAEYRRSKISGYIARLMPRQPVVAVRDHRAPTNPRPRGVVRNHRPGRL